MMGCTWNCRGEAFSGKGNFGKGRCRFPGNGRPCNGLPWGSVFITQRGWHNDQLGQDHTTTKVRFKVDGLTPYKAYWFAVQALGTDGPAP
jgi:hypothetical protein